MSVRNIISNDLESILSIQEEHIVNPDADQISESDGFLIERINKSDFQDAINTSSELVCRISESQRSVLAYLFAFHLDILLKKKPEWPLWLEGVSIEDLQFQNTKILYIKHIARKAGNPKAAIELSKDIYIWAASHGYTEIIGEILLSPFNNLASRQFHTRIGYQQIGIVNEKDKGLQWSLMSKKL